MSEMDFFKILKVALKFIWFDVIKLISAVCVLIKAEISSSVPFRSLAVKKRGEVAVITGGPRGIALHLVNRLLEMDYTVIIGARDVVDSWKRLNKYFKNDSQKLLGNVKIYEMDLKDFKSVQKFANQVKENHSRIDLLFCNAGNIDKPGTLTEDGIESQFQVNYLSGFLLVHLFKERMKESAELKGSPCQIIFTSSLLYEAGRLLLEFEKPEMLTGTRLYYTTKLCQVTAMMTLEEKFKSEGTAIHCYCVHPGVIPTDFWIHNGFIGRMANKLRKYLRTAKSGADEILRPVVCPELQNTGGIFLVNGKSKKISYEASKKDNQRMLYEKSMEIIKDFL